MDRKPAAKPAKHTGMNVVDLVSPDKTKTKTKMKRIQEGEVVSKKKHRPSRTSPIKQFASDEDLQARVGQDSSHWSRSHCMTLREMLGFDNNYNASIEWLVIGSFCIDFEFLFNLIPELVSIPQVVVFCPNFDSSPDPWKNVMESVNFIRLDPSTQPRSRTNPCNVKIPYGVHHSKFFLVGFSDGTIRTVIHTANMRSNDVHCKAQAAYLEHFPAKEEQSKHNQSEVSSDFEESLVSYLESYRYDNKQKWVPGGPREDLVQRIRRYDFSQASVVLLPSTPGYHRLDSRHALGHLKLRQAVAQYTNPSDNDNDRPIVCQFSSLGSLSEKYLYDLEHSMDTNLARKETPRKSNLKLQLVYPTVQDIRQSIEGYRGGASVPGQEKNVSKPFLRPLMRKWSSSQQNPLFKGNHVPHIKSYYQYQMNQNTFEWFAVASHNLSKAAWGEVVNSTKYGGRRMFIRSWELGVFLSPQSMGVDQLVPWSPMIPSGALAIPLPYQAQPDAYSASDQPWAVNLRYQQPDRFGRFSAGDP
jgi:tyrosyl-DNA phosphodiesterase-1